ncbi:TetR family transcriptional regulator [Streptomyces spiroverticillatus]|uniref:TetR family transcriptional regulator n=1 Tax=Streptomyces finlayi TaxID=67296 RepID=A0A918WYE4_9ACTN|nr:TetR/AcrR family transcriptional regulator C-terminal domain-containing protein [Streptomyces finlayi]GHA11217.1 TetR family transcriptional regulator [Streptomyces spiroverticillatus]GHC95116.1 TetR family transcriptional regulator [Streptomyces finlayi]
MATAKKRDPEAALALLWGEQGQPTRGPKPSLSAAGIAARAVEIADAEGLEAASMQRMGKEFGVTTMALYRYVPGRAELVELMVDTAMGTPQPVAGIAGGWRPQLAHWARQCWDMYRRHPWILTATAMRRQLMGPNQLAWLDAALGALAGTGLRPAEQHDAFLLVVGHVRNLTQQLTEEDAEAGAEWARLTGAVLERHGDRYPSLTAAVAAGAFAPGGGDPLDFGLERILDGVQALVEERR